MTTSFAASRDEICSLFWSKWNSAETSAIVGYVPDVFWPMLEEDEPDSSKFWARLSIQSENEEQTCFRGSDLTRRYTGSGTIFVQLFCPKSEFGNVNKGRTLAQVAQAAFRGKATQCGIWFRNVRIIELSAENLYYRFNVIADYEYDEIA